MTSPTADPIPLHAAPGAPRLRAALQRGLLLPLLDLALRPEIDAPLGVGRLRSPLVVVANHTSDLDCPLVLRALPAGLRFDLAVAAAADRFYRGRLRGAAVELALGTIPFDRRNGGGVDRCARVLRGGGSVLVFPEGTRSRDGRMGRFHSGAARLALGAGVPVLPVGISGAFEVLPPGAALPRPGPVRVRIGEPLPAQPGETSRQYTQRIQAAVGALLAGAAPASGRVLQPVGV